MRSLFYFACISWILVLSVVAQESSSTSTPPAKDDAPKFDSSLLSALSFRSIGPALMSGRIADIAVDPRHPNTWYVAAGSGGVWKTVNAGTTWAPIFDRYGSYSIGCLTIDPHDGNTIWVGTGEAVGGRHVGFGDGVYVSRDGGQNFQNVGLKGSEHIAKIVVDPRNSRVVYVAAQGPLWSAGGERGLYKSTDGGQTWSQILAKGEWTGVTDVALDPAHSETIYAATHQRHRTVAALINGGPESGIHKSTDGGRTWQALTQGLPAEDKGKIALAVSPFDSQVLFASIELADRIGGIYRSSDGGASWVKRSDYTSGGTGPHYYQEMWLDPHRAETIYHANVVLGRSDDGGVTFQGLDNDSKHVDNHAVAFHPSDADFLLIGCDGGLYVSRDRGRTFSFTANLPLTQFYKVDVDYDWPEYHVVGGTQDNNTQYGPARTLSANGIGNADWRITIGGDGHDCAIDPQDPNIIYCESQQGYLRRFDRATGESVDIRPRPDRGEEDFRFNWDSPILISPHSHTRIYFGSKQVHRSDDRGDSWRSISGDLSRGRDRYLLPMMGRLWGLEAIWDLMAMSAHGNITSLSESPKVEGLIYAGTDDGLVQVTEDGGKSWRRVEQIFGMPEFFFVNDLKADLHDPDTVYLCADHHKSGDSKPYVFVSRDRGRSWKSIAGDLPDRHLVWRIIQDHERPELLFLGTEFGAFATIDGGEHWHKLSGLPTIPVRDLEIQRRENDLVAATFGRSFYVLDDYSPLRTLTPDSVRTTDFAFLPVRPALLFLENDRLGGRRGSQGDGHFSADNPTFGAVFTIYAKQGLKTQKQTRLDQDAELKKAGKDTPRPDWGILKAEAREEPPQVVIEIRDARKNVVDRIAGPTAAGLHRINWNLRYAPLAAEGGPGPVAPPGRYSAQAFRRLGESTEPLGEPVSFEVKAVLEPTLPPVEAARAIAFQEEAAALQQNLTAAGQWLQQTSDELSKVRQVITDGRHVDLQLLDDVRQLETKVADARESLFGDPTKSSRFVEDLPSIAERAQWALYGSLGTLHGPTKTHRQQLDIAREQYDQAIGPVRSVVEGDLVRLRQKLDEIGAPWTPGRKIPKASSAGF